MTRREALRQLRWGAGERREVYRALRDAKRAVYRETLIELAEDHGYDVDEGRVVLSADVLDAIDDDAAQAARQIVDTYNKDVEAFLDRNEFRLEADGGGVLRDFATWAGERAEHRADLIAVTEAYGPHADATLAFYAENGIEPDFDFGEHGDDHPQCEICQALLETNPHPYERVLEVGIPHPQCRQSWHARVDPEQLPEELFLGGHVAGLLGTAPLVIESGGRDLAIERIRELAE